MRKELQNTFDGVFPEIAKAHKVLLRRMRRDANGDPILCECVDPVTREPDVDKFCPICWGEGYKWDEEYIDTYKVVIRSSVGNAYREEVIEPGLVNIEIVSFYVLYDIHPSPMDKIIDIQLNDDGSVAEPLKRTMLHRIVTAIEYRADNGKLEYWKLDCYQEQRKFLNGVSR
jgi:hypothetical protein